MPELAIEPELLHVGAPHPSWNSPPSSGAPQHMPGLCAFMLAPCAGLALAARRPRLRRRRAPWRRTKPSRGWPDNSSSTNWSWMPE
eukprot:12520640-Alexandrium_andersonii.AAC.1